MPNINSFADLVRDQERLLRAFEDNAAVLAPAESLRDAVAINLDRLVDKKAEQDSYAARRQEATQDLDQLMNQAREDARRLRGMVKGLLGTKNERLVQFKVAPIRNRTRSAKPEPEPPPPVESVAASEQQ